MKTNKKAILTTLTALLVFAAFAAPSPVSAWTVNVTADPAIAGAAPGDTVTVPVMAYNVTTDVPDIAAALYNLTFDTSVISFTSVATGSGNALPITEWNLIASDTVKIYAHETVGHTGDVNIANVTFTAIGPERSTGSLNISDAMYLEYAMPEITPDSTNNGTFTVWDVTAPDVTGLTKSRDTILNDNGRARPEGWNESQINVSVTEAPGAVQSVSINLSEIGHSVHDMSPLDGDIYSYTVTGVSAARYGNNNFTINATDDWSLSPNSNNVTVNVTVLVRGDVYPAGGDGTINVQDGFYMQKFLVGKEPEPDPFVSDVYPATGDAAVNLPDGFYMAKFLVGKEPAP